MELLMFCAAISVKQPWATLMVLQVRKWEGQSRALGGLTTPSWCWICSCQEKVTFKTLRKLFEEC
eukprot:3355292-Rhodomonas_salina.1